MGMAIRGMASGSVRTWSTMYFQLGRVVPEQLRRHGHHDVSAGEDLAGGQLTFEREHLVHDSPAVIRSQSTGASAPGAATDRPFQLGHRPAHRFELPHRVLRGYRQCKSAGQKS